MNYDYLKREPAPQLLKQAMLLVGTKEIIGTVSNPTILAWAKELGLKEYTHDSIPWCGLFMAYAVHKAGLTPIKDPLWALNWNKWGVLQTKAMLGDILIFKRPGGHHVTIYVGEDAISYHCLGGNQSDKVDITRIDKARCIGIRRTAWKVAEPKNIRQIFVTPTGFISTNEN